MSSDGKFIWHDLMTTDAVAAVAFYTSVFREWSVAAVPVGQGHTYHMISVNGRQIGGVMQFSAEEAPPHWAGYVQTPDCDAALARMVEAGGKVCHPAVDMPGIGRFAVAMDPHGAVIKPFAPAYRLDPPDPRPDGEFCWSEVMSADPAASAAFYAKAFGWTSVTSELPGVGPYTELHNAGKGFGGVMTPPGFAGPSAWVHYVMTDDVDARAEKIAAAGGTAMMPAFDVPGIGRLGYFFDPTGAMFALYAPPKAA